MEHMHDKLSTDWAGGRTFPVRQEETSADVCDTGEAGVRLVGRVLFLCHNERWGAQEGATEHHRVLVTSHWY